MGSLSNYGALKLLDHVFNTAYTPVATVYLGLCTADPTDAATGASCNEVSNANSYARTAITFGAAASRRTTQSGTVTFPTATGSWSTVTHWVIADTATYGSGNVLAHGSFSVSKSIVNGNTPSIASGTVYVDVTTGGASNYLANIMLDFMFRNQAFTRPSTYVGITTATIADSNTGSTVTEVSGGSYARKQVNVNGGSSPTWRLAASGQVSNLNVVTMVTPTASWGTMTSVFVADASSAGNLLFYDNSPTDQLISTSDSVSFAVDALTAQLS